jgi:hypothetical protein
MRIYEYVCMYVRMYVGLQHEAQIKLSKPINENIWGQGDTEADDEWVKIICSILKRKTFVKIIFIYSDKE